MKILQICNKSPYPPKEGGSMAMYAMSQLMLQQGCEVKILAVNSPKCFVHATDVEESFRLQTGIEWVYIDTHLTIGGALKALILNRSYHVERFISPEFEQRLATLLQSETFDIVQIETIYLAVYLPVIRKYSKAKVILRAHNIEHKIWERVASHGHGPFKRCYLKILSHQLKCFEQQHFNQFDGIITISHVDEKYILAHSNIPCTTIPYSLNVYALPDADANPSAGSTFGTVSGNDTVNLFSLASMNWEPNLEGIQWFLKACWPRIRQHHPDLCFRIAGRHIPENMQSDLSNGIEIVGEVPDSETFMRKNGILVVPLLSGSGIRIKIIEGMSLGKTIITTSIGAEGIDVQNGEELLIADTPEAFVEAVNRCLAYPEICMRMGRKAAAFIQNHFNEENIGVTLMQFYQRLIQTVDNASIPYNKP